MKVLGISGSAHKGGNTEDLVDKALSVCKSLGAETELIKLSEERIEFCDYCNSCVKDNGFRCPKKDDVAPILESMKYADAIIIGSPTYFASVSGKLKALFDRTLPLRRDGLKLSGKIGGAIAVGGSRNGGQEYVIEDIHDWMLVHEMAVVGDKKTAHFGGICVARSQGDALNDEVGIATVENLAMNVIETLKKRK